jgi:hypothetical protein
MLLISRAIASTSWFAKPKCGGGWLSVNQSNFSRIWKICLRVAQSSTGLSMNTPSAALLTCATLYLSLPAHAQTPLLDAPGKGYEAQKERVTARTELLDRVQIGKPMIISTAPGVRLPMPTGVPAPRPDRLSRLDHTIRLFGTNADLR